MGAIFLLNKPASGFCGFQSRGFLIHGDPDCLRFVSDELNVIEFIKQLTRIAAFVRFKAVDFNPQR